MSDGNREASLLDEHIIHTVRSACPTSIRELIDLANRQHKLPDHEIIDHILELQNQGKLIFKEHTSFPLSLKGYLSSFHSHWYWTTITVALAAATTVFLVNENTYPIAYVRHLLVSVFVLILPGYSLTTALFPRQELDKIEYSALSLGTSLAIVPIVGLLLNYTPWGIRAVPLTAGLLIFVLVLSTTGLVRQYNQARRHCAHT